MKEFSSVTVRAPATSANLAVGFDILGMAVGHLYDQVRLRRIPEREVRLLKIKGDGGRLPVDVERNTATVPLTVLMDELNLDFGFEVELIKGIPLSSGLGGSAASAVAAIVAANEFLDKKMTSERLIELACHGEAVASGGHHADNIAPCVLGGVVYCLSDKEFRQVAWPEQLHYLILHPEQEVETKKARAVLPQFIPLKQVIQQSRHLAGMTLALERGDAAMALRHMQDIYVLPARRELIHSFDELDHLSRAVGGAPLHISGAGPTMIKVAAARAPLEDMLAKIAKQGLDRKYGLTHFIGNGSAAGAEVMARE